MTNQRPSDAAASESGPADSFSSNHQHQHQHQHQQEEEHQQDTDNHSFSSVSAASSGLRGDSSPHSHSRSHSSSSSSHAHAHSHSHSSWHSNAQSPANFIPSLLSSWTAPKDTNDGPNDDVDSHHHQKDIDTTKTVQVELRQADAQQEDPFVTRVVQTVELVQVVDTAGLPVSFHTVYAPPNTVVVDRESGETVAISAPGSSRTAPASSPEASRDPSNSSPTYLPSLTYSTTPHSSSPHSAPTELPASLSSSLLSGSAPLSSGIQTPSGGPSNATSSLAQSSSNTTSVATESLNQSELRYISGSLTSTISFTSTSDNEIETSYSTTTSDASLSAFSEGSTSISRGNNGDGDATSGGSNPTASSESSDDSGGGGGAGPGNLSSQEKQIVGGVVGSVAGAAFLLLLVMMAIKWKKRRKDVQELIGDNGTRALSASPTGGNGGGGGAPGGVGGQQMAERSTAFSVPAALANLTSKKDNQAGQSASGTGERGFVRVSGKKLPSVLQHGGDGYSDPRQSTMSGESDYYRGSQSFDPAAAGGSGRLALGTPMRPVSGVPIMRTGPGRTPVTEHNPFADPPSPGSPPPPPRDALGRSLTSQDGSRGSGSRFQENI